MSGQSIIFSVGTAFLGLTQNYWQFAVLRFISSIGLGAVYVVCNTLMSEYVPTSRRTTVLGTLQAGWSVGYVVSTVLAGLIIPVYGWRFLFATGIVPVVFAVLMQRIVPEPASWVELSKKQAAAAKTAKEQKTRRENEWKVIFADRGHRKIFILWTLVCRVPAVRLLRGEQLASDLYCERTSLQLHKNDRLPCRYLRLP